MAKGVLFNFYSVSEEIEKSVPQKDFEEYFSMCVYDRFCLVSINYWRIIKGLEEIKVPEADTHYHTYFKKPNSNK